MRVEGVAGWSVIACCEVMRVAGAVVTAAICRGLGRAAGRPRTTWTTGQVTEAQYGTLKKSFMNCFECSSSSKSLAGKQLGKRLIKCSVAAAGCGLRCGCKSSPVPTLRRDAQ